MDGGNSRALEALFQPQVEIGTVNADEDIRPVLQQTVQQLSPHVGDGPIVPQDLGITADRQHLRRPQRIKTLPLHPGPADAMEARIRQMLLECGDQMCRKLVAGGLAGHHGNPWNPPHGIT